MQMQCGKKTLESAKSKIKVLYNGIDTNKFRPLDDPLHSDEENITDGSSDQPRAPTVVYVGRVEILKDVMNLIQSMKYCTGVYSRCSVFNLWNINRS